MSTLAGRNVLVVGASAGVGRAFAERAIRDGANVVIARDVPDWSTARRPPPTVAPLPAEVDPIG